MSASAVESKAAGDGFSPVVVLALVAAAVFATAGFLVLSAYAPELRASKGGGANVMSPSAIGYAGVERLLDLDGQPVATSRAAAAIRHFPGLMVLTPETPGALTNLGDQGERLIVLPKWQTAPDPTHPGWGAEPEVMQEAESLSVLPKSLAAGLTLERRQPNTPGPSILTGALGLWPDQGVPVGPIANLQTLSGGGLAPVVKDELGHELVGMAPGGRVYVLSDPDLLNTQGLSDPRTARAALLLLLALRDEDHPIAFDVSLNGVGAHSLLRLALEPPFLGATLCFLAAAGLIGMRSWSRFGVAQRGARAVALGKLALVENGAGMMRLARREPRMAPRYVQLCRRRAAAALGADKLQGEALDEFLDRWAERVNTPDRITALTAQAQQVKDLAGLTALAQRARRWRLEMTRESG